MGDCICFRQTKHREDNVDNSFIIQKPKLSNEDKNIIIDPLVTLNSHIDTGINEENEQGKLEKLKKFFEVSISNDEDLRVELIISVIEIFSIMGDLIEFIKNNLKGEFPDLLLDVLQNMRERQNNQEKNNQLMNYLLQEDAIRTMDPIDLCLHILKILNNNTCVGFEEFPNYYEEGINNIPQESMKDLEGRFRDMMNENPYRKLFFLATMTPFIRKCHNFKCENSSVSIRCEAEASLNFFAKENYSLQNELDDCYSEKKFEEICGTCEQFYANSQTRFKSHFINYPTYLMIKILHKNEDGNFQNGFDLLLKDLILINIAGKKFELIGIIRTEGQDSYSTVLKVDDVWTDFDKSLVIEDLANYTIEKAYVLFYKLIN